MFLKRSGTFFSAAMMLVLSVWLLFAPGSACAQALVEPELSKDWTVRIGLWVPNSEAAREVVGTVGISGHVERRVYDGGNYDLTVGIGYNGFDRSYSVPVMLNIIGHRGNLRFGGGAGYSFGKRLDGSGSNGAALSLILGYQLTHGKNPLTFDFRYYFVAGSNQELDGYSFTLGIKF
jgi:hypothetical protein